MADPTTTVEETDQALKERHDELSKDIRKTALLVVSYSFFCFLALGQSDEMSVSETLQLQIPFANTGINPKTFLFVGPLILILLTSYLHIFIREWSKVSRIFTGFTGSTLPYIFNLDFWFAKALTVFTFYFLPVIVLLGFAATARAHPYFWYWYILVELTAVVMLLCFLTHKNKFPRKIWYSPWNLLSVIFWSLLFVGGICFGHFSYYKSKPLLLKYAELSKNDLSGYNLGFANLFEAKLSEANLRGIKLKRAILGGADLRKAALTEADLSKTLLKGANLEGAFLLKANLKGASLKKANLKAVILYAANLEGANLEGANLEGANLEHTDLRARNIDCEQIKKAKVYASTKLPEYLKDCKISRLKSK